MTDRRRVAVITTGRQDYGILRSTLELLARDPRFELLLWVGGMHLRERFGRTVSLVEADGLPIAARLDIVGEPPDPPRDAARALEAVASTIEAQQPDVLVLLGDRSETLAAGFAAALAGLPITHLYGGEETEGAIDNVMRHALTKLSQLHLVSHELHARRVLQMGEVPESVVVVGAAGLDNLYRTDIPDRCALEALVAMPLEAPVVAVTLHPATVSGTLQSEVRAVSEAMAQVKATYVITQPNADAGGAVIREHWTRWVAGRDRVTLVDALGEAAYFGLLRIADAVLGNSSSGLLEAPSFGLPVINIGDRQAGRLRSAHVTDVPADAAAIAAALRAALEPVTRQRTQAAEPPYPAGAAAPRIVEAIAGFPFTRPPRKRFHKIVAERSP